MPKETRLIIDDYFEDTIKDLAQEIASDYTYAIFHKNFKFFMLDRFGLEETGKKFPIIKNITNMTTYPCFLDNCTNKIQHSVISFYSALNTQPVLCCENEKRFLLLCPIYDKRKAERLSMINDMGVIQIEF